MTSTLVWPPHLRTFGEFVLERPRPDGGAETVYRSGKLLAVLLHLSVQGEVPVRRAAVADLFWGDDAPERARASLRQAIASLHRLLGEDALVTTRETVMLRAEAVTTDLARAEAALAARDAVALAAVYRGPFLESDRQIGTEFDRWVDAERARWRRAYLEVVEEAAEGALARGAVDEVIRLGESVRAAEPEAELWARLLCDARLVQGRPAEARRILDEFARLTGREGAPLPEALAQRLERIRREMARTPVVALPAVDAASLSGIGGAFVGRDALLESLMAAAERARLGRVERHVLHGASGAGKSRALDELEARLRLRGARVVRVRLLPAMREVAFAGIAECTRALAALPGAAGVGEVAAATLVDFLPELRQLYRGAASSGPALGDRTRLRTEALCDLVAAVTEDRFAALLVDDAQHLDARSLAMVQGLATLETGRFLLVLSTRPPVAVDAPAFRSHPLAQLGVAEIRDLLAVAAPLPDAPWVAPFLERLRSASLGLPQRIVQIVQRLERAGALHREPAGWQVGDAEHLAALTESSVAVTDSLEGRAASDDIVLHLLRLWGRPMDEAVLAAVSSGYASIGATGAWRDALRRLESAGLVVPAWNTWAIAHDSVGEALDARMTPAERRRGLTAMIDWFSAHPTGELLLLEHLALLCGAQDALGDVRRLVAAVSRSPGWRERGIGGRRFARQMARAAGRPEWEPMLYRSLGWVSRQSRTALGWYSAVAAVLVMAVATLSFLAWPRLVVEVEPLGEDVGVNVYGLLDSTHLAALYVQPRVAVRDGFGRRLTTLSGVVRAVGVDNHVIGDTLVALTEGRAQFTRLGIRFVMDSGRLADPQPLRIGFDGPGLVMGTSVVVRGVTPGMVGGMRIVRAIVNGVLLDSTQRAVVPSGDSVHIQLTFEYTTTASTANYVVAGAPSWLPAREGTVRVAGLPRPVANAWQSVQFTLPPKAEAGHGHLILIVGTEDTAEHITSATNWAAGAPVWGDGNDLADTPEAMVSALRRTKAMEVPRYLFRAYPGRLGYTIIGDVPAPKWWVMTEAYTKPYVLRGDAIEFEFTPPRPPAGD